MNWQVPLPPWPLETVRALAAARGVRCWPVGGAVRDALLGHPIHDWDFAVEDDARGLARAAANALGGDYFPLDNERDVGRAILQPDGRRLELDFTRLRGPDLETDLRLRDLTINAMAAGPDGELIDPTGGLADLQARLVRAVGPQSFDDDPLRMLRAVRLAAELDMRLEAKTAAWIIERSATLARSSAERIRDEFVRLLAAPAVADHLYILDGLTLLTQVIPEIEPLKEQRQTLPHRYDVWWHTLQVVDAAEALSEVLMGQRPRPLYVDAPEQAWDDLAAALGHLAAPVAAHLAAGARRTLLRLAALAHDLGKPITCTEDEQGQLHFYTHERVGAEMIAARLHALRFSRADAERVETMVAAHMRPAHLAQAGQPVTRRAVYHFFRDLGSAGVEVVLLAVVDHLGVWGPNLQPQRWESLLETARTLLGHYFEQPAEAVAPPPLLTGKDLIQELGLRPGPRIGRLLEALREAQAAGEVHTRDEALALARSLV